MKKNKIASQLLIAGWVLLLIACGFLLVFWKILPPQLPWFYSLPTGEEQLVEKTLLIVILGGMALVLGLTRLLVAWASKGDEPVENTLMTGGLVAVILLVAGFWRVMQIFVL